MIYRHLKKGGEYELLHIAEWGSSKAIDRPQMAVYQELTDERRVFTRPMSEFKTKFKPVYTTEVRQFLNCSFHHNCLDQYYFQHGNGYRTYLDVDWKAEVVKLSGYVGADEDERLEYSFDEFYTEQEALLKRIKTLPFGLL